MSEISEPEPQKPKALTRREVAIVLQGLQLIVLSVLAAGILWTAMQLGALTRATYDVQDLGESIGAVRAELAATNKILDKMEDKQPERSARTPVEDWLNRPYR